MPVHKNQQIFTQIDQQLHIQQTPKENGKPNFRTLQRKRWSQDQKQTYYQFLIKHFDLFQNQELRREHKVFKLISEEIKTRTLFQVKSHHQKMIKYHKTISNIIEFGLKKVKLNQQQVMPETLQTQIFEQNQKQTSNLNVYYSQDLQRNIQDGLGPTFLYGEYLDNDNWFLDL